MISKLNKTELKKNQPEHPKQLRILKKNLIHIQGLPKMFAIINLLKSEEYFGQYGTIEKFIIKYKIGQDNNKKAYSAYVTYSNELEAALAILCLDSLLIQGKIIRAFFGTTKYCINFLNNEKCPNLDRCIYLHQYINNNDIIINNNNDFTYNDHINLAKKIIDSYKTEIKHLIEKMNKIKKRIFPSIDFILLSEEEKEKYFNEGNIGYFKNNNSNENDFELNNNIVTPSNFIINNNIYINTNNNRFLGGNNKLSNLNINDSIDKGKHKLFNQKNSIELKINNSISPSSPKELCSIFNNSINHILYAKPFLMSLKNINLSKLELNYLIEDLTKNDMDIYEILNGCLDPVNHLL